MANQQPQSAKCSHVGCHCMVPAGKRYCSEYCELASASPPRDDSAGALAEKCRCGHPPCE